MSKRLLAFDFDGVLAIPYSQPEVLFAGTVPLLKALAAHPLNVLVVTSFNPRAYPVLRDLLEDGTLKALRARSICPWWAEGDGKYKPLMFEEARLDKRKHLESMLELKDMDIGSIYFYDDDPKNLADVDTAQNPTWRTYLVNWYSGIGPALIRETLGEDSLPPPLPPPPTFFIGGRPGNRAVLASRIDELKARGWTTTFDWPRENGREASMRALAKRGIDAVQAAAVVIFIFDSAEYGYPDTFAEIGAALAAADVPERKQIYIVDPHGSNVKYKQKTYYWHLRIIRLKTWDDLLKCLFF
jgi:hypothetical protein